jgi:hypothetical protein
LNLRAPASAESDDTIKPVYSSIYYDRKDVQDTFFALLLLIVIGEFFSAPAITFVDSVTLEYLGEDVDNYGRQRMFGSLGWGLSMFFVGLALDHSSTFPDHPCGIKHIAEKNYTICFAVFSVLMSCAHPIPNPINQDTNSTDIYLKVANIFITAIHFPKNGSSSKLSGGFETASVTISGRLSREI